MINVVGLGMNEDDITLKIDKIISESDICIIKTQKIASFSYFKTKNINYVTLDDVYADCADFDELNVKLAKKVIELSKKYKNPCYAVEGSGVSDNSIAELKKLVNGKLTISAGVSKESIALSLTDNACSYKAFSMYDILFDKSFELDTKFPIIITDLDNVGIVSELKLKLFNCVDEECEITFITNGKPKSIALFEIDMQKNYDYSTAIVIKSIELTQKKRFVMSDLLEIMGILRGENGCAWDKIQTHNSIKMNVIEEAYELAEAIDLADDDKILEESGDVLLQSVFHAEMAKDRGEFNFFDVLTELCKKLIFRHSHIFSNDVAENATEAISTWDKNKVLEKGFDCIASELESIPKNFPSLLRAYKVSKKLKSIECFDKTPNGLCNKLMELDKIIQLNEVKSITECYADILFDMAFLGGNLQINPEEVLKYATDNFINAFKIVEQQMKANGKNIKELNEIETSNFVERVKKYGI